MDAKYTIVSIDVGRVVVMIHDKCKISQDEVVDLLEASGVDPETIEFVEFNDLESVLDLEGVPCIIPVDGNFVEDEELEQAAAKCANSGGSVIVVFGGGVTYTDTHPVIDKYGTQTGWYPDTLNQCIMSPTKSPNTDTDKQPTKRSDASQVSC